ncbi:hypothetical protein FRB95_013773 [Tulasnella sp. JGI-2019a]|nr:hypothetical protein FRB95_013773 [Tulasnella sp. JGI-2019a]
MHSSPHVDVSAVHASPAHIGVGINALRKRVPVKDSVVEAIGHWIEMWDELSTGTSLAPDATKQSTSGASTFNKSFPDTSPLPPMPPQVSNSNGAGQDWDVDGNTCAGPWTLNRHVLLFG